MFVYVNKQQSGPQISAAFILWVKKLKSLGTAAEQNLVKIQLVGFSDI